MAFYGLFLLTEELRKTHCQDKWERVCEKCREPYPCDVVRLADSISRNL